MTLTVDYPVDVFPESGFRLPLPTREGLDDATKQIYDRIVSSTNAGLRGPGGIQLHSPEFAAVFSPIVMFVINETGLTPRHRELVVLTTAREIDSQFEWTAHEPIAQKAGLEQSVIDLVRDRKDPIGLDPLDEILIRLTRQALGEQRVSPEIFARAKELFGPRILVNISGLIGGYIATAVMLRVFDMQLQPGWRPLLTPRA